MAILGFQFIKAQPTQYVIVHRNGKIIQQGSGLSLLCYMPTSTVSKIPLSRFNENFIFDQKCADFQKVTVQGEISYRIIDPVKISQLLNFALSHKQNYVSSDPDKLPSKVIRILEGLCQKQIQQFVLREALLASGTLSQAILSDMIEQEEIKALGIEVMNVAILAINPQPETARALEAEAREAILKAADDAIFLRRNAAVESERLIRENELETEIAVEQKKRNIRETQMEAEASIQHKQQEINRSQLLADIELETQKKEFVACNAENIRTMAEAEGARMSAIVDALKTVDPRIVQAITATDMDPAQLLAYAFTGIADKADKIGQLNLSPDLLQTLLAESRGR